MQITLLFHTPLSVCSHATRTRWQSFDKGNCGGEKDKELIDHVGNEFKHASTLEHLDYTFCIQGISKVCLQEVARHRRISPSAKNTHYTLKELRSEGEFKIGDFENASRYLVLCGNEEVDNASIQALENLHLILQRSISLDIAKYYLPESYKTELILTINARSLQNFISLHNSKSALWEIRNLASALFEALPQDHQFISEHCLYKDIY